MPDAAKNIYAMSLSQLMPIKPVASHVSQKDNGLISPGNIDLAHRPVVRNADGSISSVRSMGITDENPKSPYYNHEVLIPTVITDARGRWYTDFGGKASRERYYQTGEHLGVFATPEASDKYAQHLHEDYQNGVYGPQYVPQGYRPPQ